MKYFLTSLLIVGFAISTSAVNIKPDNSKKLEQEGEKFVWDKLNQFNSTAQSNGATSQYFKDLLTYVKKGRDNSAKLLPIVKTMIGLMAKLSSGEIRMFPSHLLHGFTWVIEGNGDNVTLAILKYAVEWINVRLPSVSDNQLKTQMEKIREILSGARECLDANASYFNYGVSRIKELSYAGNGHANKEEIKTIVARLESGEKPWPTLWWFKQIEAAVQEIEKLA